MSARRPLAANLLRQAAASYREAGHALAQVSQRFPLSRDEQGPITASSTIDEAADLLVQARNAERQAMACLADITKIQVRRPPAS